VAVRVEKVDLPGIGFRHDVVTSNGRRISIVTHRDGARELALFDEIDPDASTDSIPLSDQEAAALADLLGNSVMLSQVTGLSEETVGLFTEHLLLSADSKYAGRPLGDTKARTRTSVSIVAIVRDSDVVPSPRPDFVLEAGDSIVAVGTREGLDKLGNIIADSSG
jgi:TrkA domain protein